MPSSTDSPDNVQIYNRVFWLSYAANLTMVAANALTFHFAELIVFLGGTEQTAGEIVSTGACGAIICRLGLGQMLDRYGPRRVWSLTAILFSLACLTFMFCREVTVIVFAARTAFAIGLAGMSTASIVQIQHQTPWHRRTEVIGNFGSSGFVGMVVGSICGDLLYQSIPGIDAKFRVLFSLAAACGLIVMGLAFAVTHRHEHTRPQVQPAPHRLIVKYWPGMIMLVGMMIGVSLMVTTVFLTRMSTHRNLGGISLFFFGYCGSAFTFRVASSSWSRVVGRRWLVLLGLAGHALGHLFLANATKQWHLIIPALTSGFGHAMLFPSVVSLGSGAFPKEYRGTGTTVVLGFTELGSVISAPILGRIIDRCRAAGYADPFAPMFYSSASFATFAAVAYWWSTRGKTDDEQEAAREVEVAAQVAELDPESCSRSLAPARI